MMNRFPLTALEHEKVDSLSWFTGAWYGEKEGACFDEQWSSPAGDSMMGMFRWIQDDRVRFYEFVTIEQEAEYIVLRIKHFSPGLIGWEEKEESIAFTLVQLDKGMAVFARQDSTDPLWLVYRLDGDDTLIACFENAVEAPKPLDDEFVFRRWQR